MVHLKTKPDPALYVRHEKPTFRTQYEFDKYWDIEKGRWIEGYSGITGIHYLYLQELKLRKITGELIRPYWREPDSEFFEGWDKTKADKWDMMLIKRTELGFSTMAGAAIPIHTMLTNPGSTSIMTSADDERRRVLFNEKLLVAFDNMDDDIRPEKARTTSKGQQNLFLAHEDRATRTFSGLQSKTIGIDTVKNPTAFEAHRAMYILIDELFLHPSAATAKASAARRLVQGTEKIASMLFGGTVGEMTTKGSKEALKIYKSAKDTRVNVLALLGTRGLDRFMTNGWEDLAAAEEWRVSELERLSKAEDKTEYFKFMTDYPGSIDEVFNLVTDCALPQEVQITLNEADKKIERERIVVSKYSMRLDNDSHKIFADPDTLKGKINIVFPPQKDHVYIAGIDPIPFGNNALGEGSDFSLIIFDETTKEIVADYTERNFDSQAVVRNCVLLQRLYKSDLMFPHGAPAMLELNRGEVTLKEYLALGASKLLAPMPIHLGIIFEERKYDFGVYMNNQIAARCEALCMKFLLAHGYKLRHKRAIQEFRYLSTKTNTDVLDAIKMALLFSEELAEMKKKQTPQYTNHKIIQLTRDPVSHKLVRREVDSQLLQR